MPKPLLDSLKTCNSHFDISIRGIYKREIEKQALWGM